MATATPLTTRSFCWSGASRWTLWKSWSLGPARTWPTTVTTQRRIRGRRWSSTQNQVGTAVSRRILVNKQCVGVYVMLSAVMGCLSWVPGVGASLSCRFPVMRSNVMVCGREYVCCSLDIFRHLNVKLCRPLQASSWVCVFLSKCSPSLCHLPSDSSLSIWVLFWHRQLLSHFKKPRAHKQGLRWVYVFVVAALHFDCSLLFILQRACVCVCV